MPRTIIHIFILAVCLAAAGCSAHDNGFPDRDDIAPENALRSLNATIEKAPRYQRLKAERFDSLRNLLRDAQSPADKLRITIEIADSYCQFNADSAIHYGARAVALIPEDTSPQTDTRARLSLINALGTAGLFIPAVKGLDSIGEAVKDPSSRIEYWKSSRKLYFYMLTYVQDHGRYADIYRRRYIECDDSLLRYLPKEEPLYRFIKCERLVTEGRLNEAQKDLQQLMTAQGDSDNIYGMAAYQLAEVYKRKGDFRGYATYLATAAESDIKCCVREGLALPDLANWLYEHGDLNNAFNYINYALEEANQGNIRMRTVAISALMPVIDQAYRKEINDSRNNMVGFAMISSTLLLIAAVLLIIIMRSMAKMRSNERKLAASSRKLEAYVGNFIGLCSNYASRLQQLAALVTRKISSGQSDDLLRIVSSGKFNETGSDEFYKLIDKALLDIFPDFVDSINSLLQPDRQIELRKDDPLTPELRIYAFVRLGVDQSVQIAQILGYSTNTVYAYRNRMRNRAINRDTFDKDVADLGNSQFSSVII